ncbi:MAG TPA: O-antigen ligase family protein [Pyrinomonadaceae bacterium]|nr:O-antigen ligase family protein [Pyrinomonadaceae bacterium]
MAAKAHNVHANDSKEKPASDAAPNNQKSPATFLKPGHALSYAAFFIFTVILYARPGEFYPSPLTASIALIVALATLCFFIPTQLSLEGTLTARPREVNLVLLFCLTGLLSIPLAISRTEAWHEFSGTFIRCIVMFLVIVNVVRTEARLKGMLFLALVSSVWLSVEAINDYRLGLMTVEGYRASGTGSGIFGNTNDMALHVVTILPISIALLFGSRGIVRKLFFGACAALMVAAIVLSYSRGAFIGMIVVSIFIALKLGRGHRLEIVLAVLGVAAAIILLAPDKYGGRLLSIFFPSLDPAGSANARRGELFRSINVALHHPLLGIGMGNYQPEMSFKGLVTHNSYTQVAAEMGTAALVCYTMFIVTPLRKLARIARETFEARGNSRFYYMALGLQASLLAYMVSSFFLSVAYSWYVFYLVGYAVCLRRLYESEAGKVVVVEKRKERKRSEIRSASVIENAGGAVTA